MYYVVADEVSHDRTMFLVIHVCYVNVLTSGSCFLHIYVYHSDVTEVSHDRTMFLVIHVYDRDACNSRPFGKKL